MKEIHVGSKKARIPRLLWHPGVNVLSYSPLDPRKNGAKLAVESLPEDTWSHRLAALGFAPLTNTCQTVEQEPEPCFGIAQKNTGCTFIHSMSLLMIHTIVGSCKSSGFPGWNLYSDICWYNWELNITGCNGCAGCRNIIPRTLDYFPIMLYDCIMIYVKSWCKMMQWWYIFLK